MNSQENITEKIPDQRKSYSQPKIIYEVELETRAGSPLGFEDPLSIIEP